MAIDITSPEYVSQAVQTRRQALQPAFQQALRRSRESAAGRGMLDSGLAQSQAGQLRQGVMADLGQYASRLGMQQSEVEEQRRRAQQNRDFQMAMQRQAFENQREVMGRQEAMARERARQNLIGNILGTVGGLGGTYLGYSLMGPLGGAMGQQAGSALGQGAGSFGAQPPTLSQDYGFGGLGDFSEYGY